MRPGAMLYAFGFVSVALFAQGLNPADLLKVPTTAWPSYNGDYSGQRYSPLSEINASNVRSLALQWVYRTRDSGGNWTIKATPLEVNGVLYFTVPNNVWAVDARTGREIWHFRYPNNPAWIIGNRGVGIYGEWLYFESPDNYLICLNAKNGKERWRVQIADVKLEYFSTMAPLVIRNHVIVGVGGDSLDNPGYLESRDPETGALQWRWNSEPRAGEPGAETWPGKDAMEHGGGMTWMPGTYDPELNLLYWGTGNPNPVHAGQGRKGDNLWTSSIVALNPDTGKLVWYYQPTPHDTHDWDATQTPVLIDGEFNGIKRKLLAQANRNGYFFVLDRTDGKHLLTAPFVETNWTKGIDAQGVPVADPSKEPTRNGALVSPSSGGATNWFAPSFNPETGMFYVNASQNYSVFYLTAEGKPEGFAGRDDGLPGDKGFTLAIDYKTGKICWKHEGDSNAGLLSTAGKLLFTGDSAGHLMALDPATGTVLWHVNTGEYAGNGPMTYELNGRQYVVFGAGDTLYAFALPL
ncbi:MAG TPA: acido-empty-quinoprotein group A [Bryobacteraceae bacterium]